MTMLDGEKRFGSTLCTMVHKTGCRKSPVPGTWDRRQCIRRTGYL